MKVGEEEIYILHEDISLRTSRVKLLSGKYLWITRDLVIHPQGPCNASNSFLRYFRLS